jgi:acyl-CoA synthetase (AMP-forming)/AMP-acid ligase II
MLYDRWLRIARGRFKEFALFEVAGERRWTFGELFAAAERGRVTDPLVFPHGTGSEFIIGILRAWRSGAVLCPLEFGHRAPQIKRPLPRGIVHLKTTSATTGKARLVAFTAGQLIADVENIVQTMGLQQDWPNLGVISLAHSYGFSNLILPLLLHGVPLILVGSALPEALRLAASAQPSVTLAAVPALWQTWHHAGAIPANVRLAMSAGAPLPLGLEQSVFASLGLKIHNFYGSSECGGIAYDTSPVPRADPACAGSPLRNVDVTLAEDGCVEVRSDAVAATYWPEAEPDLGCGVFHTRDVGRFAGGLLHLCGRASDQINVAGRKVLPETIEAVLVSHPQVRACLAFGVPSTNTQRGETIVACVAANGGVPGEGLRQFAMANLPAWQVPREWWFVDSLEANGRGKLSRAEWRKRYLETARGSSPLKVSSPRSTA